ncbi:MAG: VPGUxxT family thioredoxin-like (seleno)protein, type 2 [Polyangiaceae bacterium]
MARLLRLAAIALLGAACQPAPTPRQRDLHDDMAEAPPPVDNPRELGWVHWERDYETAAALAAKTGRPLFVLFQEVPGCSTCVGFGETVLSHPLLIEAIETAFVPVAIFNNRGGRDGATLQRFGEPAWNNPVVRFVDAEGRDLIPRADNLWSTGGIARRMVAALTAADQPIPAHLSWVVEETAEQSASSTFQMSCFWQGEVCFGGLDGVLDTHAGHLDGREVVEVEYDPHTISADELQAASRRQGCGDLVARPRPARPADDSDQKIHLARSRYRYLPLTPLQATRVNAALGKGSNPRRWLSPRQIALYDRIASADAARLDGLERPESTGALASYSHRLTLRLAP